MTRMHFGSVVAGMVVVSVLIAGGCASKRPAVGPAMRESTSVTHAETGVATTAPSTKPASKPSVVATTQEAPFVKLWNGPAPGAQGEERSDTPAVQIYLPATGNRTISAIVVCPGGGYGGLAPHE